MASPQHSLLRSSAAISAWNLVSRVTGFARVLAVGAALGTTFAGNTYHTANLVSNVLFELLAAGLLSSVLVPAFVERLDAGRRADAERLAGAVLGVLLAALGAVTLVGLLLRPAIMRALTFAVDDAGVRDAEVRLGAFLLWFFLPQLLLYAIGAVVTGLLHASRRFVAAAAAPVANNVVVIATMVVFRAMGDGGAPTLDLDLDRRLVLALGTTLGVAAMAVVPVVAGRRAGLRVWPRWEPRRPEVWDLARRGAWAAGALAVTQVLVAVTLVLSNRVEGGVVAYQIAFTFFLLPHALVAHPVYTAAYPGLAAEGSAGAWARFAHSLGESIRLSTFLLLPASALLAALAAPVLTVVAVGALADAGRGLVADVLASYAVGLVGYSLLQLLTRASYAAGDVRAPTAVAAAVASGGAVLMTWWSSVGDGGDRVVAIGLAHSAAVLAGAVALLVVVGRRIHQPLRVAGPMARQALGAVAAGAAAWLASAPVDAGGRLGALGALVAGGAAGTVVYTLAWRLGMVPFTARPQRELAR